jgi:protein-disulfide isomerase
MRSISFLLPAFVFALASVGQPVFAQTSPAQTAPVKKVAAATAPAPITTNFKSSGLASAKVQIELYTDYECPACREFYLNTLPQVNKEFIQTGKVRLLHRDFPLQQHKYTRIATRYANAAGQLGKYDLVANQIFQTQAEWSQNGNLDAVLSRVLAPGDLKQIRDLATSGDTKLDDSVNADVAMGGRDNLQQTPTIVIVANGKRDVIAGAIPFPILKQYLEQKLK